MTSSTLRPWRPEQRIRAKAIALAIHDGRLLVGEVLDDQGRLKGWVPLGGGVEFGESAEVALRREIKEELHLDCAVVGPPLIFENIYEHEGVRGHDIVFAFRVRFDDPGIYAARRFHYLEHDSSPHAAEWVDIARFRSGADILFPAALLALLD